MYKNTYTNHPREVTLSMTVYKYSTVFVEKTTFITVDLINLYSVLRFKRTTNIFERVVWRHSANFINKTEGIETFFYVISTQINLCTPPLTTVPPSLRAVFISFRRHKFEYGGRINFHNLTRTIILMSSSFFSHFRQLKAKEKVLLRKSSEK